MQKDNPVSPKPEYYSINGTVAEVNDTLDVIKGAVVKINNMVDTTDENGNFNFEQVLSENAVISITHPDYNSCDTTFSFNSNVRFMPLLSRSHPDYFPNEPGNYWKYEVIDSVLKIKYVYTLKIIKDTVAKDGRFKIWEYFNRSNENEYTRYLVQIKNDKVF